MDARTCESCGTVTTSGYVCRYHRMGKIKTPKTFRCDQCHESYFRHAEDDSFPVLSTKEVQIMQSIRKNAKAKL